MMESIVNYKNKSFYKKYKKQIDSYYQLFENNIDELKSEKNLQILMESIGNFKINNNN
jgi:hypothetical protein